MSTPQSRQGFLLVTTMLVIAGLIILTTVGLTRSATELLSTSQFAAGQQAFQEAEAGIDTAIYELNHGAAFVLPSWIKSDAQGTPLLDANGQRLPCAAGQPCTGTFSSSRGTSVVTISDIATPWPTVTVTGVSSAMPSMSRRLLVNGSTAPETLGDYALFAGKLLFFSGESDSYDSRLGAYGGTNTGYEGHIGISEGWPQFNNKEVRVSSSATLHGFVKKTPWIREQFEAGATCSQGAGSNPACTAEDIIIIPRRPLPSIEVPAELTNMPCNPPMVICATCAQATLTLSAGDHCYAYMGIGSGGRLIMEPEARLYLTGNGVEGNDVLTVWWGTLEARGHNQIFAESGMMNVESQTGLSTVTGNPNDLQIRVKGNPRLGYVQYLLQRDPFHAVIYIQQGAVEVHGFATLFNNGVPPVPVIHQAGWQTQARLDIPHDPFTDGEGFGAIVADMLIFGPLTGKTNHVMFHRDKAVQDISLSGAVTQGSFKILSWRQRE